MYSINVSYDQQHDHFPFAVLVYFRFELQVMDYWKDWQTSPKLTTSWVLKKKIPKNLLFTIKDFLVINHWKHAPQQFSTWWLFITKTWRFSLWDACLYQPWFWGVSYGSLTFHLDHIVYLDPRHLLIGGQQTIFKFGKRILLDSIVTYICKTMVSFYVIITTQICFIF